MAIVRRAVWDYVLYKNADPKLDRERYNLAVDAAGWIFWNGEDEVDEEGGYTFLFVCSYLNLDPSRIRKVMLTLTREDIQRLNNYIKEG